MTKVGTPELDKALAALKPRKVNDVLTEFVDWLAVDGIVLARYGAPYEREVQCPVCHGKGFDPASLTGRQKQLLRRGLLHDSDRGPCPRCPNGIGVVREQHVDPESLVEAHESYEQLFARFLGLDLDTMEQEKRAILRELG